MGINKGDRSGGHEVIGTPATDPRGNRGLWVALGAVLAIVILAIGAVQIPKWLKTRAGESPAIRQPAVETPQPAPAQSAESGTTSDSTAGTTSQGPTPMQRSGVPATMHEGASTGQPAERVAHPSETRPSEAPAMTPAPLEQAARSSAAADQARAAELKEIQRNWPRLASRAAAIATSLQNLQREQQRQGFGLRGDISSSWKRMEHFMDQADAAIAAKDATTAREHLEDAEREIETLEKFLGR